jgi:hypothetical protein
MCASTIWAQSSSSGTITGQVTDAKGAAIAGAEILVVDKTTNSETRATTNESGRFTIVNVEPRKYSVTVSRAGFSTKRLAEEDVQVGQVLTINEVLEVGSVSTVVEVSTAPGAELQTVNATVGTTVSGPSLTYLPIFGSDASSLAIYQPGVSPGGQVAGAYYDQNTFQLDGGNNSNDMDGSMVDYTGSYARNAFGGAGNPPSGVLPTPPDTIEEFKVATAGQTADFNGASGSQIQMVTKRGTNDFHGTGYYYYSSSDVGAPIRGTTTTPPAATSTTRPFPLPTTTNTVSRSGGPCCPSSGAARHTSSSATKASIFRSPPSSTSRSLPTLCVLASFKSIRAVPGFLTT